MRRPFTTEEFINKSKRINGDKYEYDKSIYINNYTKVIISCKEHGDFEQCPRNHWSKQGCPKCGQLKTNNSRKLEINTLIKELNIIHNHKYEYNLSDYKNNYTKVKIICPIHGSFKQGIGMHKLGRGCPKCAEVFTSSKGEKQVANFIKKLGFEIEENNRTILVRKDKPPLELDIYIPKLKIGIEFNGDYWHKIREEKIPNYHYNKNKLAFNKGILLLNIKENNWTKDKAKVKNQLKSLLININ